MRSVFAIISACFVASGAAGLIYQVVWSRYLALFLGHTSYAVVAVLVAFMGGLALGNAAAGPRVDRALKPLAAYAWLEIAIGIYALVFPLYYSLCHDLFLGFAASMTAGSGGLLTLKFAFSLLLVLLPTALMGATFPVLTRFVTRSLSELRERVAALYTLNSAGAVAGCVIADFWLIPTFGLEITVFAGAALNLLAGVAALALSARHEAERVPGLAKPDLPGQATEATTESYNRGELQMAVVAIGISGFVAMLYEVAWTRLLALALGSSTHAFSLMLITFITGIALGSFVVYLWRSLRKSLLAFAWAELGLAATLFVSMLFYQYLSYWFVSLASLLARTERAYPLYELAQALVCFGVMLVPTIFLGMTLPLVSRIATVELKQTGRSVGRVFAVNTLGTVLGAVLTGFWLMPALGLARTFAVGVALNALVGLFILAQTQFTRQKRAFVFPSLLVLMLLWYFASNLSSVWERTLQLGLWRLGSPPENAAAVRDVANSVTIRFHKDGAGSTVDVQGWRDRDPGQVSLKINGKADGGTGSDMITQLLLGHLPALLHPQAKTALVIGLGTGATSGAVAQHSSIERVDAVEISPEVALAARLFEKSNGNVLRSPKFHLTVEDAKTFLQLREFKYDVIVSEPSNPWMAGVAGVFTREYYESCAARLHPDGLMVQWMHVYETTDAALDMVMRTFVSVFPYTSIWQPVSGDIILVGSTQPIQVDLEATRRRFAEPAIRSDLARVGLHTLATILAREAIPQQNTLFTLPADGPVHTDLFPQLEYLAQRGFFLRQSAGAWMQFRENFSPRPTTWLGTYLQTHPLAEEDFRAFQTDFQKHRFPDAPLFRSVLHRWQATAKEPVFPVNLWAIASDNIPAAELRVLRLAPLAEALAREAVTNPAPFRIYTADLMESYRAQRSAFYLPPTDALETALQRLLEVDPGQQRIYKLHLAEMAWDQGNDARCLELARSAFDPDAARGGPIDFSRDLSAPCAVLYRVIESLFRNGRMAEAWSYCKQAQQGGYLETARGVFPLLEVSYRRVQAAYGAVDLSAGQGQ